MPDSKFSLNKDQATSSAEPPHIDQDSDHRKASSKKSKRHRLLLQVASFGALVAFALIFRNSIKTAFLRALDIGWAFFLLIPLFILWSLAATLGWRVFLRSTPRDGVPGLMRLLSIRTQALAMNTIIPTVGVGGDVYRAVGTRSKDGIRSSAPAVVLDRVASAMAEVAFACLGMAVFATMSASTTPQLVFGLTTTAALVAAVLSWHSEMALLAKIPILRKIKSFDEVMGALLKNPSYRRAMHRSVGWHLVERTFMMTEIWLIALFLGSPLTLGQVLFAFAMTSLFSFALFYMPGQVGATEGGLAFAFSLIGLPPEAGLSVALVKRGRQLLMAGAGLLIFMVEHHRSG